MAGDAGSTRAEVAVIGGSGFYEFLEGAESHLIDTPYGAPSGPVAVGRVGGRRVAFLPRHGPNHELPPHRIPYRANLWALRQLGVTRVVAPCAVGSLRPDRHPGEFVVCDQLVDRTWGRADTFFDGPSVNHVSFADPYCSELSQVAIESLRQCGATVHAGGTVVVIQGPRFSTRAESAWFRAAGWDVVNMTAYPESFLARELGLCYVTVALVTDYDTGIESVPTVEAASMEAIFAVLKSMVATTQAALGSMVSRIPEQRSCACGLTPHPI